MPRVGSIPPVIPSGLLIINKPTKCSSFQVVHEVRKILGMDRVGHCGTLDPLASGVMVVLYGSLTSRQDEFMSKDKIYRAGMLLGIKTDSGDVTGKVLSTMKVPRLSKEQIKHALNQFAGEIEQIPPMYSAIKWNGRKLYEYARKGIEVKRPPRKVTIKSIELLDIEKSYIQFRVHCSKGTYIRTLVEDIGEALGVPATLTDLVREKSGSFGIQESITWDDLSRMDKSKLISKSVPLPN